MAVVVVETLRSLSSQIAERLGNVFQMQTSSSAVDAISLESLTADLPLPTPAPAARETSPVSVEAAEAQQVIQVPEATGLPNVLPGDTAPVDTAPAPPAVQVPPAVQAPTGPQCELCKEPSALVVVGVQSQVEQWTKRTLCTHEVCHQFNHNCLLLLQLFVTHTNAGLLGMP